MVGEATSAQDVRETAAAAPQGTVLLVDDEPAFLSSLERILRGSGWNTLSSGDLDGALAALERAEVDVVLADVFMPGLGGMELCRRVKAVRPDVEVVMMTGAGSIEVAVEAMKAGAYDFLTKPFHHADVVVLTLRRALERRALERRARFLEGQLEVSSRFENMVGQSAAMKQLFRLIESVAPTDSTVLIEGESGTGKELVARAIHERSGRRNRGFWAVNCSAFTETLLESELFGHVKGSFTGATNYRRGLFEEADGGTLFLDEVGETAPSIQAKLLRVLQDGEIKPVGSNEVKRTNARILSATNRDLPAAIKEGRFREDLYYRVNVVTIRIPPLRERAEDIPLLVRHFIDKHAKRAKKDVKSIDREAFGAVSAARWPGNIRQLENAIERAVVLCQGDCLHSRDLPEGVAEVSDPNTDAAGTLDLPFGAAKKRAVAVFEKRYVEDLLARTGGVVAEAARLAAMDRSNFRRLMARYEVDAGAFRAD